MVGRLRLGLVRPGGPARPPWLRTLGALTLASALLCSALAHRAAALEPLPPPTPAAASTDATAASPGDVAATTPADPGAVSPSATPATASDTSPPPPPSAAATGADGYAFDPEAATQQWLAKMPAAERERSDSYFEGGYWLQLWDLLSGVLIAWLLLASGLSARMRDLAVRAIRWRPLQDGLYGLQYILVVFLLGSPLAIYAGYFREHKYGLSNQTFPEWLGDAFKGLGVGMVMGSLGIIVLYAVLRRAPRTWWLWGAVAALALLAVSVIVAPVYIAPLFNDYTRLDRPEVAEPVLAMARAHGVPAHDVWVFDASRQTKRISANVSGLFGTERVSLNDNLLNRCTIPEIEAVMGHELGHYVLGHVYEMFVELAIVILLGFVFVRATFERVRASRGEKWGVSGVADVAGLPLLLTLLSLFFFLMTPVVNSVIRTNEAEADAFGLAVARQPDGFAGVALKLGEYRKLDPGPLEEMIFFDHPSGHSRILRAMRWKAAEEALHRGPAPSGP